MRIQYTLATTAVMPIFIIFIIVDAIRTPASAATIDKQCQPLYERFRAPEVSWEDTGKIAWQMMELGCWPELQGAQQTEYVSPTDCNSIGSLIMESATDPDWLKIYEPKSVVYWNLGKQERDKWRLESFVNFLDKDIESIDFEHIFRMNQIVSNAAAPSDVVRTLECLARVLTSQGYQSVYYYLDRDSEGDEFWGWLYLQD